MASRGHDKKKKNVPFNSNVPRYDLYQSESEPSIQRSFIYDRPYREAVKKPIKSKLHTSNKTKNTES